MTNGTYRLSFTTGGLLRAEAVAMAGLLVTTPDAATARAQAVELNLVQQRTMASTLRVTREVVQRLGELPPAGVELIAHGSVDDSRQLMWLAACLRYRFLRDFGREVVRDRLVSGRDVVGYADFDTFWNLQSSWVDALRDAADSTRGKLRQNTFRMLREAGLLDNEDRVLPINPAPGVSAVVAAVGDELLLSFPIHDAQVAALAGRDGAR
ncbi:BrxA family protein [Nocardia sp. R6R-6]|uniref:BrxA family protein n=1 Tax=Nocardia sp. R6R-6 TaxID=3459303 RepID=UPI00403DDFFC